MKPREELSSTERECLNEELKVLCGPRPSGSRSDAAVASWRWAYNWIRRMTELSLSKRQTPARRGEIRETVATHAELAFESPRG